MRFKMIYPARSTFTVCELEAMAHGPVEIVDLAMNSMVMFHNLMFVCQRVFQNDD